MAVRRRVDVRIGASPAGTGAKSTRTVVQHLVVEGRGGHAATALRVVTGLTFATLAVLLFIEALAS